VTEGDGIEKLIRPDLFTFNAYTPCKSPDTLRGEVEVPVEQIIKLDANENPYGCSPRVNQALATYPFFSIYPDAGQTEIRELLQGYTGVGIEHIVAGSGSDDMIELILRLLITPGDEVINCVPTFDMFRFITEIYRGTLVEVSRNENFDVRVEAIKSAISNRTKIIVLVNPNSPTGTITTRKAILELVDTGIPVLVDEAYFEFSGETVVPLVSQYRNLMVLRTFSKWAGLAGIRVGYGVFPPKIAECLLKTKQPYNVSMVAQVAVKESLKDLEYLLGRIKAIVTERERLFGELQKLKWLKPYPSLANFILCLVLDGKAKEIQQELQNKGILIRYFDQPLLRNYIRISVGKPEHTDALITALKESGGS
jgi:histidinol-phosphate aminotransferase